MKMPHRDFSMVKECMVSSCAPIGGPFMIREGNKLHTQATRLIVVGPQFDQGASSTIEGFHG
ncbi:MAG: hypothetical protein KKD63_14435 [Proteobacteria bacterium]|nr:hypothetical protein [Desulfobulbaceae bacterium]MBU4154066.1 hypothetical protein [Pseudomonadota bacterium]